jgi:hypothetical protein
MTSEEGDLGAAEGMERQTPERDVQTTPAGVEGGGEAATWQGSSETRLSEPDVPPGDVGQLDETVGDEMAGDEVGELTDSGADAAPESGSPATER